MNLSINGKVIAATRSEEEFSQAVQSLSNVIFDLAPDLLNVSARAKKTHEAGKQYFVHLDLAKGLGKDESGVRFLKHIGIDGILSTKVNIIKIAREHGLFTVQRFFIVDSRSVQTTAEAVKTSKPDMIEIMPGTVYKVIERMTDLIKIPVIAGGLIENSVELKNALISGAAAVSTGSRLLWNE